MSNGTSSPIPITMDSSSIPTRSTTISPTMPFFLTAHKSVVEQVNSDNNISIATSSHDYKQQPAMMMTALVPPLAGEVNVDTEISIASSLVMSANIRNSSNNNSVSSNRNRNEISDNNNNNKNDNNKNDDHDKNASSAIGGIMTEFDSSKLSSARSNLESDRTVDDPDELEYSDTVAMRIITDINHGGIKGMKHDIPESMYVSMDVDCNFILLIGLCVNRIHIMCIISFARITCKLTNNIMLDQYSHRYPSSPW